MTEIILANEVPIRLAFFFGIFAIIASWEATASRRTLTLPRSVRWPSNIGIVFLNTLVLRFVFPTAAVGFAYYCEVNGYGILNMIQISFEIELIASILIMDCVIYFQHVVFHKVPILWRLHRMHHADTEYDVTTGARFHPIEIILSMLVKFATILILGAAPVAVIIFEIILNGCAMFNHGNIRLPKWIDSTLRLFLVTPDMHRVHHSTLRDETDSNYGFNLPWWDYIFRTYKAQPDEGHEGMTIGLPQFRSEKDARLDQMLLQPFRKG